MTSSAKLQMAMLNLARWSVVCMLFSLSFSKALFNASGAIMVAGCLLSGDFRHKWSLLRNNPVSWAATGMFALIATSAVYSEASKTQALYSVSAYAKLLFIPIIISLVDSLHWRRRCWYGYAIGMLVLLAHVYADIWLDLPWTRNQGGEHNETLGVFHHYIAQTLVIAFFAVLCLHRGIGAPSKSVRTAWLLVAALAAASITHLSIARTGQVTLLVALLTLLVVSVPRRWVLPAGGAFILAALLVVFSSGTIQDRFRLAYKEVSEFQFKNDYSSVGARLQMWNVSLKLIQEKPLLGHGAGSYTPLAQKAFADETMCKIGCAQPHNQYLLFGVETGLVGMLAFVSLMVSALVVWRRLPDHNPLIPVYVVILALTCLSDSGLFIRAQAYFFVPILGLLASGPLRTEADPA